MKTELKEHEQFLSHQIENNHETQLEIDNLNSEIYKQRRQQINLNENNLLNSNELISLKHLLANQSNLLQETRQRQRQMIIEKENLLKSIEKYRKIVTELTDKLEILNNKSDKATNRLNNLNELAESEQKAIHSVDLEIGRLSQMLYRSRQILQQWNDDNKNIQVNILSTVIH